MARYELTNFEWKAIKPHLPNKPRGVPCVDDRRVLNRIFGCYARARPGATCRSASARARRSTIASTDGGRLASGIA